ncbi:MAG: MBL fold metallo-hydrolase [Microcystaceae cyanobacterium]
MGKSLASSQDHQTQLSCLPYGVGHNQEGVCLLIHLGEYRLLLDCGITNMSEIISEIPPIDAVILSHAHADHVRGLLDFHQAFPDVPVYASEVTAQLLPLNWSDHQLALAKTLCTEIKWRSPFSLFPNLSLELYPSGHLPGAAATLITYQTPQRVYKLFYTGDFSLSNLQLVEGLSVESLRGLSPDILVIEGSYGTKRHPHRRQQEKQLMQRIDEGLIRGKNVLLPVPTLGLGQEILKLLRSHHQFTGRELDIWVGGKLADACDIYLDLLSELPISVQNFAKHQSLFWDERICPRLHRLSKEQHQKLGETPSVFVTDDLKEIQSYLAQKTLPWLILIPEHLEEYFNLTSSSLAYLQKQRAEQESYLLAEHSDGRNTTQLIHNLRPQHIIFVHGSANYLTDLINLEELHNRYQIHSPAVGTLVELPIGDRFIQPENLPSPTVYEGELNEQGHGVTLNLPPSITLDPRWSQFSDTGLLEGRWQGEELVLRGISQKELANQPLSPNQFLEINCCQTCCHYRGSRCWNSLSPLNGYRVTPEGYCPAFEEKEEE